MEHHIFTKYIRRLGRFNVWANRKLCLYFAQTPEVIFSREIRSSFPSIRLTMLHIWDAEIVWRQRMLGHSITTFPSETFDGPGHEILRGVLSHSEELNRLIQGFDFDKLTEKLDYTLMGGQPGQNTRAEMIQHCVNHSSYHRGQLVVFARQLELPAPPSTDMIYFMRDEDDGDLNT